MIRFRESGARIGGQYWSDPMTSFPWIVLSANQVNGLIVFLMNFTLPSPNNMFTPPGCLLLKTHAYGSIGVPGGIALG